MESSGETSETIKQISNYKNYVNEGSRGKTDPFVIKEKFKKFIVEKKRTITTQDVDSYYEELSLFRDRFIEKYNEDFAKIRKDYIALISHYTNANDLYLKSESATTTQKRFL